MSPRSAPIFRSWCAYLVAYLVVAIPARLFLPRALEQVPALAGTDLRRIEWSVQLATGLVLLPVSWLAYRWAARRYLLKSESDMTSDALTVSTGAASTPSSVAERPRPRWRWCLLAVLACAYAPYAWLLATDEPWGEYRWSWVRMWPLLPGLLAKPLLFRDAADPVAYAGMAAATFVALGLALWLARKSRRALAFTALLVLALSCLNSWSAWHAFRA